MLGRTYSKEFKKNMFKLILQELKEDPYYKFKIVFALMGVIPLLTFVYIVFGVLSCNSLNFGKISPILYILIAISLLAFFLGYGTIRKLIDKIIFYVSEIKRSEQLKADLAASVSHDFEIPIGILKHSISNLISADHGGLNDTQQARLKSCLLTLENMSATIKTLLDLYKIEAGLIPLKRERCDISLLLKEKISEFSALFAKNKLNYNNICAKELFAYIDKDKIKEVINNLLSNFLKYTSCGGWIELRAFPSRDFIRIELANNSEFIPEDKLSVIFDKFIKLDEAKEGSGLGLAIAKDIVELHRGDLWVENVPGKGIMFVVILPCV